MNQAFTFATASSHSLRIFLLLFAIGHHITIMVKVEFLLRICEEGSMHQISAVQQLIWHDFECFERTLEIHLGPNRSKTKYATELISMFQPQ